MEEKLLETNILDIQSNYFPFIDEVTIKYVKYVNFDRLYPVLFLYRKKAIVIFNLASPFEQTYFLNGPK